MIGWRIMKMDEVCDLITCGVAARPEYVAEGIPFLSAKNVKDGRIIWEDYKFISEKKHQELTKYNKPERGDVLYTRVGSYGEAAIVDADIEFSIFVSLTLIKPKSRFLNSDYLKYYLNSNEVKQLAQQSISGSGVGNLNVGAVRKFPIPIPPLSEQKRIVEILNKVLAAIDKAKVNVEKNLQNARELFENLTDSIFTNEGDDWYYKSLNEVASFKNGLNFTKNSNGQVIKIVGVKDFRKNFWVPLDTLESVKIDGSLDETYCLQKDDILTVRSNGNPELIGRMLLVGNFKEDISFSGFTIRIRLNSKELYPPYLCHFLKSKKTRRELVESGTGVNIKSLNQGVLSALKVSIPKSYQEQQSIVEKLEALSRDLKRLETLYGKKLNDLQELKKAILQKAFSGELTSTTKNLIHE